MPIYIYETIEPNPVRFEVKQRMSDGPLSRHPETGAPVRRLISGGYGYLQKSAPSRPSHGGGRGGCCCGGGCGCGGH